MRINELLTESQLQHLEEGPILKKIGSAVGNAARGVANTVGAVAGGVVGAGQALKKGFQAGKAFVGNEPAASGAAPSAQDINAQGPAGTAPAVAQTGAAGTALAKTTAAVAKQSTAKAGQTVYAQVKANIDKLDKRGKQKILQLVQKSMATPDPKPAVAQAAEPAVAPVTDPGAAAFGNMAKTLTQEPTKAAAEPAAPTQQASEPAVAQATEPAVPADGKLTAAQQAAKKAELLGRRAAGNSAATTQSKFGDYVKKASGERVVGANKDGSVRTVNIKASKVNYGNALSEALEQRVKIHKQKMFETGLSQGAISVFRK